MKTSTEVVLQSLKMTTKMQTLPCLLLISLACCILTSSYAISINEERKVYIVYMGDRPESYTAASVSHVHMLKEVIGRSFNGFVAKLTESEKERVAGMRGVVSVFPNRKKKLHTTRSWDFMGFPQNVTRSTVESDIIIGVLDTGIWPESLSFNDEGYGPPPSKWKGSCQESSNFTCNNKIIGAKYYHSEGKYYPGDIPSPRDSEGHGSHTSSTAAGNSVSPASLLGLASGTARGGVPKARIAVYKICWATGCYDADILAAFDDAIADGVDIISLSVGGWPMDYFEDSIAIGAFHSMKNGILTSNSAGNEGPDLQSVSNCSPWSLSVAASTIDRKFVTRVKLGNGATYEGVSVNTFDSGNNTLFPVIYGGNAANTSAGSDASYARYCEPGTLNQTLVTGKIIVCDALSEGDYPLAIGARGSIMQDDYYNDSAFSFPLPVSYISQIDGANVLNQPTANILQSDGLKDQMAPQIVSFSSRGPNPITSDILKPDLTAPGVDILAAWSEATTVTGAKGDNRVVPYNIISGTSMSCPHATAAAAYVKSFHPSWSPGAIKSALMTTAFPLNATSPFEAEFAYGSGHINPVKAIDPGLIYDAGEIDYVKLLCGQGYNATQLQLVTGDSTACSAETNGTVWDLNYPSFAMSSKSQGTITRVFHRNVTNVGSARSTYKAVISSESGLNIQVVPNVLPFQSVGQGMSFTVTVEANLSRTPIAGSLVWDDGEHQVRSPIVAFINQS